MKFQLRKYQIRHFVPPKRCSHSAIKANGIIANGFVVPIEVDNQHKHQGVWKRLGACALVLHAEGKNTMMRDIPADYAADISNISDKRKSILGVNYFETATL